MEQKVSLYSTVLKMICDLQKLLRESKIELHQYFNLKSINFFNTPLLYNMKNGIIEQIMIRK